MNDDLIKYLEQIAATGTPSQDGITYIKPTEAVVEKIRKEIAQQTSAKSMESLGEQRTQTKEIKESIEADSRFFIQETLRIFDVIVKKFKADKATAFELIFVNRPGNDENTNVFETKILFVVRYL